ncbi:unnamed protein product [Orchesella dallaii]|uniref:Serpin domain-containing protein n=1 Tax=Orchesella dallaii TaxID=48710 RepID=A0ABP1RCN9_9HEXA
MGLSKTIRRVFSLLLISLVFFQNQNVQCQILSTDNNAVSLTTFQTLGNSNKGSLVASPFSLRTMMAMLMAGAQGNTREQIKTVMKFPTDEEKLFTTFQEYIQQLNSPSEVKTEVASRVFLKEGFLIKENFQNVLKHYFQSPLQQINFGKPKKAAEEINNFVSTKTNHRIQKIVDASDLTNQTRMVLVNTLYFKGAWENPFPTTSTRRMPFYLDDTRNVQVDMMRLETYYRAVDIKELDCKAVLIPYQKGKKEEDTFQMVILLPNKRTGLANLEKGLNDFGLVDQVFNVRPRNIELRMPRFNIESSLELIEPLKQMGITDVFDENKSDLGAIPSESKATTPKDKKENQLYVSKVVQKAFLTVDEAGSEAGAATLSVVFVPLSIGPPVEEVISVDRPFFGFIRDAKTKTILFTFKKTD